MALRHTGARIELLREQGAGGGRTGVGLQLNGQVDGRGWREGKKQFRLLANQGRPLARTQRTNGVRRRDAGVQRLRASSRSRRFWRLDGRILSTYFVPPYKRSITIREGWQRESQSGAGGGGLYLLYLRRNSFGGLHVRKSSAYSQRRCMLLFRKPACNENVSLLKARSTPPTLPTA